MLMKEFQMISLGEGGMCFKIFFGEKVCLQFFKYRTHGTSGWWTPPTSISFNAVEMDGCNILLINIIDYEIYHIINKQRKLPNCFVTRTKG